MSARTALALIASAGAGFAALQGAAVSQAQSADVWEATPIADGTPIEARQQMSTQYASAASAPAAAETGPSCGQVVARFNEITRSRMTNARSFAARYGNMTLSSRKLTGFCGAYEINLETMYDQVAEMNYLADAAGASCPVGVPVAIRQQADHTLADYSSGSARFDSECNFDSGQ